MGFEMGHTLAVSSPTGAEPEPSVTSLGPSALTPDPSQGRAIDREMWALAVPALGALLAEPAYVLADTAVVGNIGTAELGGLGLAAQVISTVIAVSIFLAYGTTSAVSRLLGAGRDRDAAHQATQGLWIGAGAGVAFAVLCFVLAPTLMDWLQAEPDVAGFGVRYLRISVLGFPAMLIMLAGVGYLRGLKDTKRPLIVAAVTATGNLVLEVILVFGLGYGLGASALSTVMFQWIGAGAYLYWIGRAGVGLGIDWRPHGASLRALGRDGFDLFIRTSALRLAFIAAAAFAAAQGKVPLGSHEIATALFFFVALGLDAIAIAGQAMVGTLLGADDAPQARRVGRRLTAWGLTLGLAASVIVLGASTVLPELFTNDPAVADQARELLWALAAMQPIAGVVFALDGILIGAGDLRYLAIAMPISTAVFLVALGTVILNGGGIVALWVALNVFMVARAATLLWRLRGDAWAIAGDRRS